MHLKLFKLHFRVKVASSKHHSLSVLVTLLASALANLQRHQLDKLRSQRIHTSVAAGRSASASSASV